MSEPWRFIALLCLLGATACGGGGSKGTAAAPPSTTQVVVFGAAIDPSVGVLLPYSLPDIRVESGVGGYACPPSAHVAPGGIAAFDPAAAGLGGFPVPLGTAITRLAGDAPPPDFGFPDTLESDCDASAAFPEIDVWLDAALREAEAIVTDLETCVTTAEMLYCEIVRRVEAAETTGFSRARDDLPYFFGPGQQGRPLPDPPVGECARFVIELDGVPPLLDALRFDRARCEDVLEVMQSVIDRTRETHDPSEKARRLAAADALLYETQGYLESGRTLAARLKQTRELFVVDDVKASCASCVPVGVYRRPDPAGNVQARWDGEALARVVAALAKAVERETDILQRERLEALAEGLRQVPGDRVLHFTFVGRIGIGTDYVALADPTMLTEDASPRVVVLSVLPIGTEFPEPNTADLRLLHEAYRLFVGALTRDP